MVDFTFMLQEQQVTHACVQTIAQARGLPASVLYGILEQEGGKPGLVRTNKNQSKDVGVTQINTRWLDELRKKYGIRMEQVRDDPCFAVDVSGYILQIEMKRTKGDFWRAIGNYHSRSPEHHWKYLNQIHPKIVKYHEFLKRVNVGQ